MILSEGFGIRNNFAPAANNLAYNYAAYGGNIDIALGLAQRARGSNPTSPTIADTLGYTHYKKGTNLTAIELLTEANGAFKGDNPTVLYHLALAYEKAGEHTRARDYLRKAFGLGREFADNADAKRMLEKTYPRDSGKLNPEYAEEIFCCKERMEKVNRSIEIGTKKPKRKNRIKKLKDDLSLDIFYLRSFDATDAAFRMGGVLYNLLARVS